MRAGANGRESDSKGGKRILLPNWRSFASIRCKSVFPSLCSVKRHPTPVSFNFMVAGSLSPQQISDLLATSGYWQSAQLDELAPLVYDELRQLAHRYMRGERP